MIRPNILWIVTTQWRAQATGYAGDPNARTPHLDALAARAVNFRQAVTPHPFGPFARAALLTGVPSPENGVKDYFDPLPTNAVTIAHRLGERGYSTAYFGKWHLAKRDPSAPLVGETHARTIVPEANRGGFQFWEGFESGFLLNDPLLHGTRLPEPTRFPGYQSDVLCDRAATWIDTCGRQKTEDRGQKLPIESGLPSTVHGPPWFVVVSLEAPHPPYDAPAAGIARRDPKSIQLRPNVPRGGEVEARARRDLAGYYSHLEATDRAVGRLVDSLGRHGGRPSIVVFTSVHGDMHGSHGLFRKGWPHEESVRVPLLIHVPGVAGTVSDAAVSLLDLSAMTLGLAAGSPASGLLQVACRSSLGSDIGRSAISMPSVVALPDQCDRVWRGERSADRKTVLNADGSPWLEVDLKADPLETGSLNG